VVWELEIREQVSLTNTKRTTEGESNTISANIGHERNCTTGLENTEVSYLTTLSVDEVTRRR
jgi:hypothetical protein